MKGVETRPGSYQKAGEEEKWEIDNAWSKGSLVPRPVLPQETLTSAFKVRCAYSVRDDLFPAHNASLFLKWSTSMTGQMAQWVEMRIQIPSLYVKSCYMAEHVCSEPLCWRSGVVVE